MGCEWCQDGWGPPGCPDHTVPKSHRPHPTALLEDCWEDEDD